MRKRFDGGLNMAVMVNGAAVVIFVLFLIWGAAQDLSAQGTPTLSSCLAIISSQTKQESCIRNWADARDNQKLAHAEGVVEMRDRKIADLLRQLREQSVMERPEINFDERWCANEFEYVLTRQKAAMLAAGCNNR